MTFVSEAALRDLVREALASPPPSLPECLDDMLPVLVNPAVGNPLERCDGNVVDVEFVPHDSTELEISVRQMVKNLPDDIIPDLYARMRELIDDVKEKEAAGGKEENGDIGDMTRMSDSTVQLGKTESIIRTAIRKMIREAISDIHHPDWRRDSKIKSQLRDPSKTMGLGGEFRDANPHDDDEIEGVDQLFDPDAWQLDSEKGPRDADIGDRDDDLDALVADPSKIDTADVDDETSSDWDPEPVKAAPEKTKKSRKKMDGGVGEGEHGAQLADIAKEMGISPSGVRRLMDTGLAKTAYMSELGPQEAQEVVLDAADEYIQQLAKSGELDKADVNFLYKHIDMVAELDGFREFLHKHIRNSMKADGEWVYDKDDE
jgi:hypothetical protein